MWGGGNCLTLKYTSTHGLLRAVTHLNTAEAVSISYPSPVYMFNVQ